MLIHESVTKSHFRQVVGSFCGKDERLEFCKYMFNII